MANFADLEREHVSLSRQRVRIGCTAEGRILAIGHESIVSQKNGQDFIEPVSAGSHSLYAGAARRFTIGPNARIRCFDKIGARRDVCLAGGRAAQPLTSGARSISTRICVSR